MEILSLISDFDPVSFACGVTSATAVAGSIAAFSAMRKKTGTQGVEAKRAEHLAQMKPVYANLVSSLDEVEALADEVTHEFSFAYPNRTFLKLNQTLDSIAHTRKTLNDMLTVINTLENTHLTKESLEANVKSFNSLQTFRADDIQTSKYALNELRRNLDTDQSDFVKFQNSLKDFGKRLTALNEAYAEAETRYDKVYLEKVPPAIFQAEKQYDAVVKMVEAYTFNTSARRERLSVIDRASDALRKAENFMSDVNNFSDVAFRQTTKMRVSLRNSLAPRTREEEAMRDEAIVSLMEAESFSYVGGNPPVTFADIVTPYTKYAAYRIQKRK